MGETRDAKEGRKKRKRKEGEGKFREGEEPAKRIREATNHGAVV